MIKQFLLLFAFLLFAGGTFAQVQIDQAIQLTGTGSNAKVSGIDSVSDPKDAVSAEVVQSNSLTYAAATGAANAFAVSFSPAIAAYTGGQMFTFLANSANTGPVTINVNGLGVRTILKNGDQPLAANDIKADQVVTVVYDGTNFQMVSQLGNASSGGGGGGAGSDAQTLIFTVDGF